MSWYRIYLYRFYLYIFYLYRFFNFWSRECGTINFSNYTVLNNLGEWVWNILYKTITVWRKQFYGEDMRHPFKGKVRCVYNISEFKKVSLRKLKHLSSWACSVITYLLMGDSGASTDKKRITALRKIFTVEPAASIQKLKWMASRPWNAFVQVENGNSIRICCDLWIDR